MFDLFDARVARKALPRRYPAPFGETQWGDVTGYVYFAGIGGPRFTHVKIGYTGSSPADRLRTLQTGCPFRITMIGVVLGCLVLEHELHDILSADRCEGEWFAMSDYVERVVADMMEDAI